MTKLLLIAAPIAALGAYVLWRALSGRALSRFTLNVVVALYLLVYLVATAGLGIFWVARMDLPAFDLHYLFGYCVVLLVALHVAFQLRLLGAFARRISPKALLDAGGTAFRPSVRLTAGLLVLAAVIAPFAVLAVSRGGSAGRLHTAVPPPEASAPGGTAPRILIERSGERVDAVDYLHEQSSYGRAGVLRSVPIVTRKPEAVKTYPGARRVLLPAPRARAGKALGALLEQRADRAWRAPGEARIIPLPGGGEVTLGALAEMLHYSAGVTSGKAADFGLKLRAAASSGALFPTDVYVVARAVKGIEPALYYYQPHEHALLEVRGAPAIDAVDRSLPASEPRAPVSFVLGVTFDRTVHKYNVRSYRYVALDTGHLGTNLELAAIAAGWPCAIEPDFDDSALAAAIGAEPEQEGVLAVLACDKAGIRARSARRWSPAARSVPLPERADDVELTRLSHRITSWELLGGPPRALPVPDAAPGTRAGLVAASDVFEAITSRRSFRDFAPNPLRLDELNAVLYDAYDLGPRVRGTRLTDLRLLVRAVEGLAPGHYRYAAGGRLELVSAGDRSAQIQSAGLSQELLGRAAVVLVWTLSPAAGSLDGARDYRHANFEAGLAGENAYLSATARDLGICGVGAFYDDEVTALLASGGDRPRALYLQGLGKR